jgi:hypothetical protein
MSTYSVTIEGSLFTKRGHNQVMNIGHRNTMTYLKEKYIPLHFSPVAYFRYGFKARSLAYTKRKLRKYNHNMPNVYSGRLMQAVLNNSRITATRSRGTFQAKGYFPMTRERRDELEIVNEQEQKSLSKHLQDFYIKAATLPEFQDKLRIRKR